VSGLLEAVTPARNSRTRVAVVGCGLIGRRRARAAMLHSDSEVRVLCDRDPAAARAVDGAACDVTDDWRAVVTRPDVDVVAVATPNGLLADIAVAALQAGKHVLMEKPMGRDLGEALRIRDAAAESGRVLGVGFNHRHHPAVQRAVALVGSGGIGRVLWLRARYGHGGRPGLEQEWRSDPAQAGGGELLDQGIHLIDLFTWIAGVPTAAFGMTQTAAWHIEPLEDNAFGMLRFRSGAIGQLHVSMTQWKNLFSLEVHGDAGAVVVEGLGGSYGVERLACVKRAFAGGAPEMIEERFEGPDESWSSEWHQFLELVAGRPSDCAGADDGVAAMRVADALYRSAASGSMVQL
jgi:predicted dehydrogenase